MKKYSKDNLPQEGWKTYRKKRLTDAMRIEGPFEVETTEGVLVCKDGYLAIDSRGFPYPIDKEEFEQIYWLVEDIEEYDLDEETDTYTIKEKQK